MTIIQGYILNKGQLTVVKNLKPKTLQNDNESDENIWIDVVGLKDQEKIQEICHHFEIHNSIIQDILHSKKRRPKIEILDNYVFWIFGLYDTQAKKTDFISRKVCMIVGKNYILTFRDIFDAKGKANIEHIHNELSKISDPKSDYLAYVMMTQIVEEYHLSIEHLTSRLEALEDIVIESPKRVELKEIYFIKRKILFMQKLLSPIAEITKLLVSGDIRFIHGQNYVYFKKLNDKTLRSIEMLDFYQTMIGNIFDIYLSSTNNQTNQSVTLLTKFATFFIPCTFITGIYGMNFDNMPELHTRYGYFIVLGIMFSIALGMSYYFNRRD